MEIVVSRKPAAEPSVTLRDADIGSERVVTRRSLLGSVGLGIAAGAIASTTAAAETAAKKKAATKKQPAKKPPPEETDSD